MIFLIISIGFIQCVEIFDMITSDVIWPEKPPYFKIGDTLIYRSEWHVDSFYVEEATLYAPGETEFHYNYEVFLSSIQQIDCEDSCYTFNFSINPVGYRIHIYGINNYSNWINKKDGGNTLSIGAYDLNNLYEVNTKSDTITGREISKVYYSKKFGLIEYELTNGEAFYIEEKCITRMDNNH